MKTPSGEVIIRATAYHCLPGIDHPRERPVICNNSKINHNLIQTIQKRRSQVADCGWRAMYDDHLFKSRPEQTEQTISYTTHPMAFVVTKTINANSAGKRYFPQALLTAHEPPPLGVWQESFQ
jgi:hypothetical protein